MLNFLTRGLCPLAGIVAEREPMTQWLGNIIRGKVFWFSLTQTDFITGQGDNAGCAAE